MTMPAIPADYRSRKRLWINASLWLLNNDRPTISSSIQSLGYAERLLLDLESQIAELASDNIRKKKRDGLLMECSAHSEHWIMGLYEVLRTIKETGAPRFDPLQPLFEKLEWLRMPIAKHETKKVKGKTPVVHYPTHYWNPQTGHSGWSVFDPNTDKGSVLFRTVLADEFLTLAAKEPEFPLLFPIGGPLGLDEDWS